MLQLPLLDISLSKYPVLGGHRLDEYSKAVNEQFVVCDDGTF